VRPVLVSGNLDGAKLFKMLGDELCIQQQEITIFEARNQVDQRNFTCVSYSTEHAFAKERSAERHAIKSANKFGIPPRFDAMNKTCAM